jgi:SAM-dependent methyltransferase
VSTWPEAPSDPRRASAPLDCSWQACRVDFASFDTRGYRTLGVREGYGGWAATYEASVPEELDLVLLDALSEVAWGELGHAADLGCGTGRTGLWLRSKGVASVDGVDLSPEMLAVAQSRNLYDRLVEADVSATGLEPGVYDLVVSCLVDEHLPRLQPLYREAGRLARPGSLYVLVGYHPHFIMAAGMPTHFRSASGDQIAIETHVHLLSDHVTAGLEAGWTLVEMRERVIDDRWLTLKPKWQRFRHHPISVAFVWRKTA